MQIANMTVTITATVKGGKPPAGGLTRPVDSRLVERLDKIYGSGSGAAVTSMRLSLTDNRDEPLAAVLEHFGNDPEGACHVNVQYATRVSDRLNEFVEKMGKDTSDDIIAGVKHDG